MVLKLFEDTGERIGLKRVKTVGRALRSGNARSAATAGDRAHPPGTVIAEITPGYRFGERLVRPAMVVVARKPPAPKPPDPDDRTAKVRTRRRTRRAPPSATSADSTTRRQRSMGKRTNLNEQDRRHRPRHDEQLRRRRRERRADRHPERRGRAHDAVDRRLHRDAASGCVGQVAKRQAVTNARNTIYAIKRMMGRPFDRTPTRTANRARAVRDRRRPRRRRLGQRARQDMYRRRRSRRWCSTR